MEQNLLFADIAADVQEKQKEVPKSEKLKELTALLIERNKLSCDIEQLQQQLTSLSEQFKVVDSLKIPDLFDELGLKQIKLSDGRVVEIKLKYSASIGDENRDECFDWLREKGHGAIIKHEVKVDIKKGVKEEHEELIDLLDSLGLPYKDKDLVHPQTLLAFVKEQIESGADFPKDLFKVYPLRSTKVK